ncbi:MAG: Nif3-like dinuclear metal center hexameric protein [Oscillospiraceae bacterium]|nr:Nif3-like dinuclear metal center hexameric protein [Oscillospiraceae bacterium]
MVTVGEIEHFLYALAPRPLVQSWDNVGLLVGRPDREVKRILVSLDVTEAVAEEAQRWGAELIVAHHPVIFGGVKSLTDRDPAGRTLLYLVEHGLAAICMHTNLDAAAGGVNDLLAGALGLVDAAPVVENGIERVGTLPNSLPLPDFLARIKEALRPNGIRFVDGGRPVHCVAVGGGACGDFFPRAAALGCDTFVTADVKYHQFLDAQALGLSLIDAGHFPTENLVCPELLAALGRRFPELELRQSGCHGEVIQYYL